MKGNKRYIEISGLEEISKIIFNHLRESHGDSIELTKDYYYDVDDRYGYGPVDDPQILAGQLYDDLDGIENFLKEKAKDPEDTVPISYHIECLAAMLRFIGNEGHNIKMQNQRSAE